jgi:hypothetical protein
MNKITIDLEKITADLDLYKQEKARLSFELKNVEKEIEKMEMQLAVALQQADVDEMQYGLYSFGWKISKRKAFDQRLFKEQQPELFEKYYIEKENKKIDFKINK